MLSINIEHHVYTGPQDGFLKEIEQYDTYKLLAMESGSFNYTVGNEHGEAGFGDLIVIPPFTSFKRKAHTKVTFHFISFTIQSIHNLDLTTILPSAKLTLRDITRLSNTYAYMRTAFQKSSISGTASSYLAHLITDLLLQSYIENNVSYSKLPTADHLMIRAAKEIQQRWRNKIDLEQLANSLQIRPSELTRRFKLVYNITPMMYATQMRLEEVKRLLLQTNDTIDSIATQTGFQNGYYLSRVFTEKTGNNPSIYRKKYQL